MPASLRSIPIVGVRPHLLIEPPATLRSEIGLRGTLELLGTVVLMAGMAAILLVLAVVAAAAFPVPFPWNYSAAVAVVVLQIPVFREIVKKSPAYVELDGDTLRSVNFFTRRVTERALEEVAAIRTTPPMNEGPDHWLGPICGVWIDFRDGRDPFLIGWFGPAMHLAPELADAVLFRLAQRGPLEIEKGEHGFFEKEPFVVAIRPQKSA